MSMSTETESLRDLYLDVAGEETITEQQEDGPSHDPIEATDTSVGEDVSAMVCEDGLTDAVDGAEMEMTIEN